jgi:hypothetical protein
LPKPKPIKDGIYYDMPPEQYYGSPALGSSKLKAFAESPLHYHKYAEMEDTPALAFGRAAHMYVLEGPEIFKENYVVMPEGMIRRGKDYDKLLERAEGKTIVNATEFQHMLGMREQLMNSEAKVYIEAEGAIEVSLFWTMSKIKCKGRLDKLILREVLDTPMDLMIDYKTCASAEAHKCMRSISDYKYYLQEAHYGVGYHRLTKRDAEMLFIFQEKVPPYDICLMKVSDGASPLAYEQHGKLIKKLGKCLKTKEFPGRNADRGIIEWGFYDKERL